MKNYLIRLYVNETRKLNNIKSSNNIDFDYIIAFVCYKT